MCGGIAPLRPAARIGAQRAHRLQARVAPNAVDRLSPVSELARNDLAAELLLPARPADVGDFKIRVVGENRPCAVQPPLRWIGLKEAREENNGAAPAKALRHPSRRDVADPHSHHR